MGLYFINVRWPERERERREVQKKSGELSIGDERTKTGMEKAKNGNEVEYSSAEKAWMKRAFGGESKLLASYGLTIHKEEDRREGRSVARAIIEKEAADAEDYEHDKTRAEEDKTENENEEEEEEEKQFVADLESDPASHLADRFFSEPQLDFVEKHYRHSGNFLLMHGLKPFDDEDCEEGVAIVRAFVQEDEDEE